MTQNRFEGPEVTDIADQNSETKQIKTDQRQNINPNWLTMGQKIIQWNCRGLKGNINELLLLKTQECPAVTCLQETFFKQGDNLPGLWLGRLVFVSDVVSKPVADSRPKGPQLRLGHPRVGELLFCPRCTPCITLDLTVSFKLYSGIRARI